VFAWHCVLFVNIHDKFLRCFIQSFGKSELFENVVTVNETWAFNYDKERKDRLQFNL